MLRGRACAAALGLCLLLCGCGLAPAPGLPAVPPLVTALASLTPPLTLPATVTAATATPRATSSLPAATRPPTATPTTASRAPAPSATRPACAPAVSQIISISVPSTTYPRPVPATVYLPPCYNQASAPLPVIYLLHGGNSDQTQWPDLNVQKEADALIAGGAAPFLVVMPGGIYGTYGVAYDSFVLTDLIPGIEHIFNADARGRARAVGGVS